MGERPIGTVIHRKNSDGDYEPGSCLWINKERHNMFHGVKRRKGKQAVQASSGKYKDNLQLQTKTISYNIPFVIEGSLEKAA